MRPRMRPGDGCAPAAGSVTASVDPRPDQSTLILSVWKRWVPELSPGDVVVGDNLKPHLSEEAAGARVVPLPPWSPDLAPVEEMVSKLKGALRTAAARAKEAVYAEVGSALHDVTLEDIAGWFQDRAAYAMQL